MLSLGDLLGSDSDDSKEARQQEKVVAKETSASRRSEDTSTFSKRSEDSKARLEKRRQEQKEREEKQKDHYSKLREISGIPSDSIPKVDSFQYTSPSRRQPREAAAQSPPSKKKGRAQSRSSSSSSTQDSLEEYGVMVADRGTQTHLGQAIETQTDPPAKVFSCRECYKKHFGREPEEFDAQCEHRSALHNNRDYEDFCNIIPPEVPISAALPTSAHWKLQLNKMHHMLNRTLSSLAPDVELAGQVLQTKVSSGQAEVTETDQTHQQPDKQLLQLVSNLEVKLSSLQAAHEDLQQKHEQLSSQKAYDEQGTLSQPSSSSAPQSQSQPQPQPQPESQSQPQPQLQPQPQTQALGASLPPAPVPYYPPYYGYPHYPYTAWGPGPVPSPGYGSYGM
eukprot:TRINITY_DN5451_c1_g1_i1.p1 TRINITY_DN5451_c1_g1~~TRINITY_DN5451_c1_g1_i1.p1  ORF type:complete len:393 (+),score=63.25 TRINITY_DN5451_c1_g1_i1:688-1866(+)